MEKLRTHLQKHLTTRVDTYIQSGNILFESAEADIELLQSVIHDLIMDKFKLDVPVQVKTADYWTQMIQEHPWINNRDDEHTHYHVTFLKNRLESIDNDSLEHKISSQERFQFAGSHIYIYCPNGYGKTKLNNNYIERIANCTATTRNWKTILKLQSMIREL